MIYTLEKYLKKVQEVEKEKDEKIILLVREFAFANNTVKVGDIVTDHIGSIIVESINSCMPSYNKLPSCVYFGLELKKDKTPRKDKSKRRVHSSNLI